MGFDIDLHDISKKLLIEFEKEISERKFEGDSNEQDDLVNEMLGGYASVCLRLCGEMIEANNKLLWEELKKLNVV